MKHKFGLVIFDMQGTLTHEDKAIAGAAELAARLHGAGIKTAVVSDYPDEKIKKILDEEKIDSANFDALISSVHYAEAFGEAAEKCGAENYKTAVCSGSMVAVKVASKLGMKALAVKARFDDAMYKKAGADGIFSDIAALSDYLEE